MSLDFLGENSNNLECFMEFSLSNAGKDHLWSIQSYQINCVALHFSSRNLLYLSV